MASGKTARGKTARALARASLGAVAATGLLFGAVMPAGAATSDRATPSVQTKSTVDPLGGSEHALKQQSKRFLELINQARQHPGLYPPHGNTAGAARTACPNELRWSRQLYSTARHHNHFLATKPLSWVKTYPNMHRGPDGKLVWESGEPMDRAGYHSFRAEIVAWDSPDTEAAVRAWMQDDAASHWRHRNLILNCAIQEAGPGVPTASPGGHYYTVDMGNQ